MELVTPLLSLSTLGPLLSSASTPVNTLAPTEIRDFLQDMASRFEPDNEIDDILGPVVLRLLFHPSLFRPEGLGGSDSSWRCVIGGLEALVSVKPIAVMITRLPQWNPPNATAATLERVSLMGPLCRLGVFPLDWVCRLSVTIVTRLTFMKSLPSHRRTSPTRKDVTEGTLKPHTRACGGL